MERASFYFQIFFESIDLQEKLNTEFTLLFRLFQLPVIEVDTLQGMPGYYEIQTGKRLSLKMPFIEVLDECPLFLLVRTPRPGHTSERRCQHRLKLQRVFRHAIEAPRRYVQQKFTEVLKEKNDQVFGNVVFTVSVCYTSSTQEALTNLEPIILQPQLSTDFGSLIKSKNFGRKDMATNTRAPLAPDPPETRTRSIFYFDRKDLMEENRQLAAEIRRLTDLVQQMKNIVEEHKAETKPRKAQGRTVRRKPAGQPESKVRTDYIYHPPGLSLKRK